jgi:hypothetical protein
MALEKKDVFSILVAGAVGIAIAPIVLPTLMRLGRPTAKSAIKGAMLLYQSGREGAAELMETVEDLVAEAQAEIEAETAAAQAVVTTAPAVAEGE